MNGNYVEMRIAKLLLYLYYIIGILEFEFKKGLHKTRQKDEEYLTFVKNYTTTTAYFLLQNEDELLAIKLQKDTRIFLPR